MLIKEVASINETFCTGDEVIGTSATFSKGVTFITETSRTGGVKIGVSMIRFSFKEDNSLTGAFGVLKRTCKGTWTSGACKGTSKVCKGTSKVAAEARIIFRSFSSWLDLSLKYFSSIVCPFLRAFLGRVGKVNSSAEATRGSAAEEEFSTEV